MGRHKAPPVHSKREEFERIIAALEATLNDRAERCGSRATFSTVVRGEERRVTVHMPDAAVIAHVETRVVGEVIRSWRKPRPVPESIQIAIEHLLGDR